MSAEESRATEWLLADAQASEQLGAVLARTAAAAAQAWAERALIVFLCGDLGAGKTTLARGVLRELGVTGTVRSPSYTLLERYETPTAVGLHVDLYRLRGDEEVEALGLRDELRAGVIMLVEWPERALGALPPPDLRIELNVRGAGRAATIAALTVVGQNWLRRIESSLMR